MGVGDILGKIKKKCQVKEKGHFTRALSACKNDLFYTIREYTRFSQISHSALLAET